MQTKLLQDIARFFEIYQGRTASLIRDLSPREKAELDEELELLKNSVLNRIAENRSI